MRRIRTTSIEPLNTHPFAQLFCCPSGWQAGTLIISSPVAMKRVENVRQHPKVAILFSPVGIGPGEPKHVLLVQGLAEVDDTNLISGWKRYFAGWARRQPSARESLARMGQAMPGYTQRALIRVRPTAFSVGPMAICSSPPKLWR